jgi:hypothetical protein
MTMFTLSMLKRAALLVLAVIASQGLAQAQTVGLLTGTQLNPDQFYVGAHAETPPLIDRLTFRPSIEVGLANSWRRAGEPMPMATDGSVSRNPTNLGFNFEFAYHWNSGKPWHFYAGGGPALVLKKATGGTISGGGASLLFGAQYNKGLFIEVRKGFAESPSAQFAVGYSRSLKLKWR